MASASVPRLDLTDVIYEKEHLYTCIVCFEDKDLRQLPCGHIECADCIDERIAICQRDAVSFTCKLCTKPCPGENSSSFPAAKSAMAANQAVYANRAKNASQSGASADSLESATEDFQKDARSMFERHSKRVAGMQDPAEREKAEEHMELIWAGIEWVFKKLWEWIKSKAMEWFGGRLKTVIEWITRLFF